MDLDTINYDYCQECGTTEKKKEWQGIAVLTL